MRTQIIIEDHVVPQLLTTAIESYEIDHKSHLKGRANSKLETYGLLWGYPLPARDDLPARLVAVMATVETSAIRHKEWVQPDYDSICMKRDFFKTFWPQLELIGTFHSHPYDSLKEVNYHKGWRASGEDGDMGHWPQMHEKIFHDAPELAHLIITITQLERLGTAWPERLPGSEARSGVVFSAERRKFWFKAYSTRRQEKMLEDDTEAAVQYTINEEVEFNVPSLDQFRSR
ncbi:MAG: hypothetical protein JKY26_13775 [Pseudomonas sp.]|nr:hypothetical protein [Pseudomonas sp.]